MSQSELPQGIENASQKHESELVIDLAADRHLQFWGVTLVILLGVAAKIFEVTGQKVTCYPVYENKSDFQFIKHADAYCWATPTRLNIFKCDKLNNTVNGNQTENSRPTTANVAFLTDSSSSHIKNLIKWMPYIMLCEAFLLAVPMAFWHFRVGGVLTGHLKFMQLLLQDIYESVKTIPAGIYRKEAYDKDGECLNCWAKSKNQRSEKNISKVKGDRGGTKKPDNKRQGDRDSTTPEDEQNLLAVREDVNENNDSNIPSESKSSIDNPAKTTGEKEAVKSGQTSAERKTDKNKFKQTPKNTLGTEAILMKKINPKEKVSNRPAQQRKSYTKNLKEGKIHAETSQESAIQKKTTSLPVVTVSSSEDNIIEELPSTSQDATEAEATSLKQTIDIIAKPDFVKEIGESNSGSGNTQGHKKKSCGGQGKQANSSKKRDDGITDRHILSMLCYENFASLQHQPYLKSVQKLVTVESVEDEWETADEAENQDKQKIMPLKHAILRQYCHSQNFSSRFLVQTYRRKHIIGITLSFIMLVGFSISFGLIVLPVIQNATFLCDVPHHDHCMSCTFTGLVDFYAAFFTNFLVIFLYFVVSCAQLRFVTTSKDRNLSRFLDDIRPLCGIALIASYEAGKN